MANIGNFRPQNTISPQVPASCPHLASGLKDWHDPSTWGGSVPANWTNVTIPANTAVLISSCSIPSNYIFRLITIPIGSTLIFGDAPISISATGFKVNGNLDIGSPTCRIQNKISITLYGSRGAQTLPALEYVKGIFVDGSIDLHGVEYFPTWTRLAKTANAGDQYLFIQDCPNWQPGQSIVITTTELKDSRDWHRNEEMVISNIYTTTISSKVCAVYLSAPLQYTHYGGFEYQAEVALLNRNILVQGDAINSEPTDNTPIACKYPSATSNSTYPCENTFLTGFGAHILVTAPATNGRFSGVEVFRGGQTNVMGRYPIHFHMLGNLTVPNMFFASDCSVHHSFFRCFTIHGTSGAGTYLNGVTLTKNTGYDIVGHCFFCSEDGVEENNTISYNFASHIHILGPYWQPAYGISTGTYSAHPMGTQSFGSQYTDWVTGGPLNPNLALADDIGASCFYFTNAYVRIIGNAASGGWSGFSFPNLKKPVGLHRYAEPYFCPKNRPLIVFQGNSAHSTGYWQGHAAGIYLGGNLQHDANGNYVYTAGRDLPARDTCRDYRQGSSVQPWWQCVEADRLWMQFLDAKVFLCNVGLQSWGDREELIRFEVHDVQISTNVFGQVWIDRMLVNCRSSNVLTKYNGCTGSNIWQCNAADRQFFYSFGGFQFYDTGQTHIITNSVFKNCRPQNPNCGASGTNCSMYIFMYLTHSDQFTPGLMQATKNITYGPNIDRGYLTVPSTSKTFITVSGRDANWMDHDGTVVGLFPGTRTNIGSDWAGTEWWRYNSQCVNQQNNWICPLNSPADSTASLMVHFSSQEDNVGGSICGNGNQANCPIGAHVAHFGRTHPTNAYEVAMMPRITGPIIAAQGGWYLHFIGGTPTTISIDSIQLGRSTDLLHLAIPIPAGSTNLQVYAQSNGCTTCAQTWCAVCTHPYQAAASIAAVRNGYGDDYFYDSSTQLLHIRVRELDATFNNWPYFSNVGNPWPRWNASTVWKSNYFSRGGVELPYSGGGQISIVISYANTCWNTNTCDILPAVPAPMPITPPVTSAPTNYPTTVAPTNFPLAAPVAAVTPAPTNPTLAPTAPTKAPTAPTLAPTNPTVAPTAPTLAPTAPTKAPTAPTLAPTNPTVAPTAPTLAPTAPTKAPTAPTLAPTNPTVAPTAPTLAPTAPTKAPTAPTLAPTNPTPAPTSPTNAPTSPTNAPTAPTAAPTPVPVGTPTEAPTPPTAVPTVSPTPAPTELPTSQPSANPTPAPSAPTPAPTSPTDAPTPPTDAPTAPTSAPTPVPVGTPTVAPTPPSEAPSAAPTTGAPTEAVVPTEAVPTQTAAPTENNPVTNSPTESNPATNPPTETNPATNPPTVAPVVVPVAPVGVCQQQTNCGSCLQAGCVYCPNWENSGMSFKCQDASFNGVCKRRRRRWCEDELDQIMSNWTSRETNAIIVAVGANGNPFRIDLTITFIASPVLENGVMKIMIYFTSQDNSWSSDQRGSACQMLQDAVGSVYGLTSSRLSCDFSSLSKRAINNGIAQVSVVEAGSVSQTAPGSSGIPIWIIIVAVVGGILLLLAVVIIVYLVMKKRRDERNQWEKY